MSYPYETIPWDVEKMRRLTAEAQRRRITYLFGGKHALDSEIAGWKLGIDCSGWVRYLFKWCAGTTIPDGSWNQAAWCESQGFKSYGKAGYLLNAGLKDGRVRLATFAGHPGHIWLCWMGRTYESYGGHGPGSRAWSTPGLVARVQHVFVLTDPVV